MSGEGLNHGLTRTVPLMMNCHSVRVVCQWICRMPPGAILNTAPLMSVAIGNCRVLASRNQPPLLSACRKVLSAQHPHIAHAQWPMLVKVIRTNSDRTPSWTRRTTSRDHCIKARRWTSMLAGLLKLPQAVRRATLWCRHECISVRL